MSSYHNAFKRVDNKERLCCEWSEVGLEVHVFCCCIFPGMGAHGWVQGLCQPWGVIQSRGWQPKVEALGYPRHQTSTKWCSCWSYKLYKYWGKQILFQSVMFLPLGSSFLVVSLIILYVATVDMGECKWLFESCYYTLNTKSSLDCHFLAHPCHQTCHWNNISSISF